MLRHQLFKLTHELASPGFNSMYHRLSDNQWASRSNLRNQQEKNLHNAINYAYNNVPFYNKMLKSRGLRPENIRTIEDLKKLPIINKNVIRENWKDLIPRGLSKLSYYDRTTGGSTGNPLQYRITKFDRFLSGALMYRGWSYSGYELGDKMFFLGGSSIGLGKKSQLSHFANEFARNTKMLSSFDLDNTEMENYVNKLNINKPSYGYGYASSLYFFSKWIEKTDISVHSPKAIYTTAETLLPHMRKTIEAVFNCEVHNAYGLNDGGVSAHECSEHSGLHIDTERSVMEVVDSDEQIESGSGHIVATSLWNNSMPFIRYDTGDIGTISDELCSCGRGHMLLKEIAGRQQELLLTPEGKYIHGEFFSHIIWEIDNIIEFQVVQEDLHTIVIKIIPDGVFDRKQNDTIIDYIHRRSPTWNVKIQLVDKIDKTIGGKYRFVINNMNTNIIP